MRKKIIAASVGLSLFSTNIFAGECDWVPGYNYQYGHKSVNPSDVLSSYYASNVVVCITDSTPSNWIFPLNDAISRLNSQLSQSNSYLRFSGNSYYQNCTLFVKGIYAPNSSNYAEMDRIVDPGNMNLGINTAKNLSSNSWRTYTVMHELLHAVGLGHTGMNLGSKWVEVPGTDSSSTTNSIGNSIMCATTGSQPILTLNYLDIKSVEYLY